MGRSHQAQQGHHEHHGAHGGTGEVNLQSVGRGCVILRRRVQHRSPYHPGDPAQGSPHARGSGSPPPAPMPGHRQIMKCNESTCGSCTPASCCKQMLGGRRQSLVPSLCPTARPVQGCKRCKVVLCMHPTIRRRRRRRAARKRKLPTKLPTKLTSTA
jgi:hypothetical protein